MRLRILTVAAVVAGLGAAVVPAAPAVAAGHMHAVFVQTNLVSGNTIQVYDRADNGTLTAAATYATHGLGGNIPNPFGPGGATPLGSQGSLAYVAAYKLLLAANAGSNTISVFSVNGDKLTFNEAIGSEGCFPNSIAVQGNLVYVLNAGNGGSISAYNIVSNGLLPVPNGLTQLNDGTTGCTPPYTLAPSDILITPDSTHVLVNVPEFSGDNPIPGYIQTFSLNTTGRTVGSSVITNVATTPFAFMFTPDGLVADILGSFDSNMETFQVNGDNTLTLKGSADTGGQIAGCWDVLVNGYYYETNTVSDTISSFKIDSSGGPNDGQVTLVNAVAASEPNAAPIDEATSGGYLYVQLGVAGQVIGYQVNSSDGSLTQVTLVSGLPQYNGQQGMEGIAAN